MLEMSAPMLSTQIVHTIGTSIYFVVFILLFWFSRIPRANAAARWWARAILFALLSRLLLFILFSLEQEPLALLLYGSFSVLEKACLAVGICRFFNLTTALRWFWAGALITELWLLITWLLHCPTLVLTAGLSAFNIACLLYVAGTAWRERQSLHRLMTALSATSSLLALHWLFAFPTMEVLPEWKVLGLLVGTVLMLAQYLLLLMAVLVVFQQRLLDAEERALELAFHDPLTGLNNKLYMGRLFEQALALASRLNQLLAVIYIDLDNFKPINDSAGHSVGDEVLKIVARRLQSHTRSADICARIGGDEFMVIATQLEDENQARVIAEKLRSYVTEVIHIGGRNYYLGASIGISLYPYHGSSLPQLIQNADSAMYQAKRNGKNGYQIFGKLG